MLPLLLASAWLGTSAPAARAVALPDGFQAVTTFDGLEQPSAVRFAGGASDPVFVSEKRGVIISYSSVSDTTPTTVADLRTEVYNRGDRGLLGLAVDPGWPARPYVYALYTRDASLGGTAPQWGGTGDYDACPRANDACLISGRLLRLKLDPATLGETVPTQRKVLVDDWCAQFPVHSIGDLQFGPGPDPQLFASGGDGAGYDDVDYGQFGQAAGYGGTGNVCGDPPGGSADLTPPAAEGGALRSQDLRTPADPVGLNGSIIRIDPDTGDGSVGNPLATPTTSDPNARRIVAEGLRNPFRFALRPGTGEIWAADVGWNRWEELDRLADPAGPIENFGWPCYEGGARQAAYEAAGLSICQSLYAEGPGAVVSPYWSYVHKTSAGLCTPTAEAFPPYDSSALTGVAFKSGGSYPQAFANGGVFLADYARGCVWFMAPGPDGLPDPNDVRPFATFEQGLGEAGPVDLERGPGGDLYWVDIVGGRVVHADYSPDRPVARLTTDRSFGSLPLTVQFDAGASTDPQRDALSYAWDLDGNGSFETDTGSAPTVPRTYTTAATLFARVRVSEAAHPDLFSVSAPIRLDPGNTPPHDVVVSVTDSSAGPSRPLQAGNEWYAGQTLTINGTALDSEDPGGAPSLAGWEWAVIQRHCQGSGCHSHQIVGNNDTAQFYVRAPDHEYPSYLQIRLTVRDSTGLSTTVTKDLEPATRAVILRSVPAGRTLALGPDALAAPWTATLIRGGQRTISATATETENGRTFVFDRWSDSATAPRSRQVSVWEDNAYTALYRFSPAVSTPSIDGSATIGATLTSLKVTIDGSAPVTIARRWERCDREGARCAAIAEATSSTYVVRDADVGSRLRVVLNASNDLGEASGESAPSEVVAPANRTAARAPTLRVGRDGRVALKVTCPGRRDCQGTVVVARRRSGGGWAGVSRLRVAVRRATSRVLRVRLDRKTLKLVAKGNLGLRATVLAGNRHGTPRIAPARFTLQAVGR